MYIGDLINELDASMMNDEVYISVRYFDPLVAILCYYQAHNGEWHCYGLYRPQFLHKNYYDIEWFTKLNDHEK